MAQMMDTESIYQRGFELRCNGQYPEARAEFLRALEIDPSHADSRWQLGLIQGFEGDFDGSFATLSAVVQEHPRHEGAIYDLAMTEMMLGMMDEACGHFKYLLSINPNHEDAQRQAAYCP